MEKEVRERLSKDDIIVGLARLLPKQAGRPRTIFVLGSKGLPMLPLEGLVAEDWYRAKMHVLAQTEDGVVLLLEPAED